MLSQALLVVAALLLPSTLALGPVAPQVVHPSACPSVPGLPLVPNPLTCPALEVSGRVDVAGVVLEPAFQVVVPSTQLARTGRPDAVLSGYSADGRNIFTFAFEASGPFHLYVPVAPATAQSIARLHLAAATGAGEQVPVTHGEPDAEVIALDESHVLLAWNARAFPSIRVLPAPGAAPLAVGIGKSTYQELTFSSTARAFVVDFSDGIRSSTRIFRVFGRN